MIENFALAVLEQARRDGFQLVRGLHNGLYFTAIRMQGDDVDLWCGTAEHQDDADLACAIKIDEG